MRSGLLVFLLLLIYSCQNKEQENTLFILKSPNETSIDFENTLRPTEEFNMYVFKNYYNGGGVAVGDINNDGLQDLYFTGNEVANKLFLNLGDFQFKNITDIAGVACENVWSSGASFVDINQDGLLDLYVCKSGQPTVDGVRHNELFINNGDNTFTESAKDYGLDFIGLGVHAVFFDFDKDEDLDCYLLNNSIRSIGGYDLIKDQRLKPSENGNKLLKNEQQRFIDVSSEAGIYSSEIGFGLGVTVGDINQDGWQDLYVSNDFFEKDYLYINEKDGTFSEQLERYMSEISQSSMGADFADINNDLYPDLFVTDMLPENLERYRTKTHFINWDNYSLQKRQGYHHQFVRNSLQLNNQGEYFQEISRFANVGATDWSWGALIFDMNNDGHKDIFVANGIGKDLTDQDYVNFYADKSLVQRTMKQNNQSLIMTLMDEMPAQKVKNYAFLNTSTPEYKSLRFQNKAEELGLKKETFSNGSVYVDLDNDGDLDLVVSNVNDPAGIYENQANQHYIKFDLKQQNNLTALGSKVFVYSGDEKQYQEVAPYRGFQSCVDPRPNFGLGSQSIVDSVKIIWPNNAVSSFKNLHVDSIYTLVEPNHLTEIIDKQSNIDTYFNEVYKDQLPKHFENTSIAFDEEPLLLKTRSREGPRVSNLGDGNFFMPGAKGAPGKIILGTEDGSYSPKFLKELQRFSFNEGVNSHVFDANGDGLEDLYICYGGDEFRDNSLNYQDQLLLKTDDGYQLSDNKFPRFSTSVAKSSDLDNDGDLDLFIAPRLVPGSFGVEIQPEIWINNGNGQFQKNEQLSQQIHYTGFITDAEFMDTDKDGIDELIVIGEWGEPMVYYFDNEKINSQSMASHLFGFWNRLKISDIDQDGDKDILLGNLGENSFLKANKNQPLKLFVDDFDENGNIDQFVTIHQNGQDYAVTLRDELVKAIPSIKDKYLKFKDYQSATIQDMFGKKVKAKFEVNELRSGWLENTNEGFIFHPFPQDAQFFPIYAFEVVDVNKDGKNEIVLGGNYSEWKPQLGCHLAGKGVVFTVDNKAFKVISAKESGLILPYEVRDILVTKNAGKDQLVVFNNNAPIQIFEF